MFTVHDGLIWQMAVPLSVHVYGTVWSNLIIVVRRILIFVLIAIWCQVNPGWTPLLVVPALLLLVINCVWIGLLFGLVRVRFREFPLIVTSLVQVVFFITPVIWKPTMLPGNTLLLDCNPFYHLVEIVRGSLVGYVPSWDNRFAVALVTVAGWAVTLLYLYRLSLADRLLGLTPWRRSV